MLDLKFVSKPLGFQFTHELHIKICRVPCSLLKFEFGF